MIFHEIGKVYVLKVIFRVCITFALGINMPLNIISLQRIISGGHRTSHSAHIPSSTKVPEKSPPKKKFPDTYSLFFCAQLCDSKTSKSVQSDHFVSQIQEKSSVSKKKKIIVSFEVFIFLHFSSFCSFLCLKTKF